MSKYHDILRKYWGYDCFRPLQEDIIKSIGSGKDTLGLMPTGGGKSLTFQVPTLAKEGICIVITPLIALMKDQVQNLHRRGIKATAVYSGMSKKNIITALENCIFGNYKFLYVSPERLSTTLFRSKLAHMNVCMITVDESHCISQWGYDFRPSYLKIAEIRELLPNIPVLALTATATPEVVDDIQEKLHFKVKNLFKMSFERKNLAYVVREADNKEEQLLHIFSRIPGSGIVYVRNRRKTKEIMQFFQQAGITAEYYHAGINNVEKDAIQSRWQNDESRVMVATNAFGMGIDKPDVRIVVHIDLPDSPEAYFQEAGRAGRDGKKAYAIMLYSKADKLKLQKRIVDTFPDKTFIREVYENINYHYQMAVGDGLGCIYEFNLEKFCRIFHFFPTQTNSALKILTQAGYIEYTDEQDTSSRLCFLLHRDDLYRLNQMSPEIENMVQVILRRYTGLFTDFCYINEKAIASLTAMTAHQIYQNLCLLDKRRIVKYIPQKRTSYIIYTRERREAKHLFISEEVYEKRKERYTERIKAMINYVTAQNCRSRMLLRYFGEKNEHNCMQCDVCLNKHSTGLHKGLLNEIATQIIKLVTQAPLNPEEIIAQLNYTEEDIETVFRFLIDEEKVNLSNGLISPKK